MTPVSGKGTGAKTVCVYCASSQKCHADYMDGAFQLGQALARNGIQIVYGGGGTGLMGRLAEGALGCGGRVVGVIPEFLRPLELGHPRLSELVVVGDMRERKQRMIAGTDACIALPGGCGTLEELFEAITLKRLGIYLQPIILVNIRGFFDPCIELLRAVRRRTLHGPAPPGDVARGGGPPPDD